MSCWNSYDVINNGRAEESQKHYKRQRELYRGLRIAGHLVQLGRRWWGGCGEAECGSTRFEFENRYALERVVTRAYTDTT
jgi:hypothetical protein